jgi:aconitate hydratase
MSEKSTQFVESLEVAGKSYRFYSLQKLEKEGIGKVSKLPLSLRVVLESLVRNFDGFSVTEEDIATLANWNAKNPAEKEIPFKVSRVLMQDFTGVPCIVDLAAMRDVVKQNGLDPKLINPVVPIDLVIDHSIQVDYFGIPDALSKNMELEFKRNKERYVFLKWAQKAFSNFTLFPPGVGIVHQVNLEYLGKNVVVDRNLAYFDSLVGTDSHTTMINGLGIVGWGVGGIEAEAAMLGEPVTFLTPKVVGVELTGSLREGVTSTDLVLTLTELLRKKDVVGKFVEFYGEGVKNLSVPDRATVSNMCPEYGATIALFPVDEATLDYLRLTGRAEEHVRLVEAYYKAQGMFGLQEEIEYSETIEFDLSSVEPTVAGPSLPWSKLTFDKIPSTIDKLVEERNKKKGGQGGKRRVEVILEDGKKVSLGDGDIVIAAITSCTNTSNPTLMIGAALLAKKAFELGLHPPPYVKTSSAPGSRVVTDYLTKSGLMAYLDALGFSIVGYGCTTCIGNSGPLPLPIEKAIQQNELIVASVLSGNRNFEMRINKDVRANYLMSPPLVVAFALAGSVNKDLSKEPIGIGKSGPVYLKDIWPNTKEIEEVIKNSIDPEMFRRRYSNFENMVPEWNKLEAPSDVIFNWDPKSTYIRKPPFFDNFSIESLPKLHDIRGARALLILGDSVTTDHISPAGSIEKDSPAGKYLIEHGVQPADFNSYGARRGNHEVMMRGTFANTKIKNLMLQGVEGGYTIHYPSGERMTVYEAAMRYKAEGVPLVVIAGKEYGAGSSRDWAAKGPALLGVKAVIAESFERIHRSNLVGMGVLPLQFLNNENAKNLGLKGNEKYDILGLTNLKPSQLLTLRITRENGEVLETKVKARLDTPVEVEYYLNGGILHYVLRNIIKRAKGISVVERV